MLSYFHMTEKVNMLDELQIRLLQIYKICYYRAFSVVNNSWIIKLVLIWVLRIFKPQYIQMIRSHAVVPIKAYKTKIGKDFGVTYSIPSHFTDEETES